MYILIFWSNLSIFLHIDLSICHHILDNRDMMKLDDSYLLRSFIIYGRSIWEEPLFKEVANGGCISVFGKSPIFLGDTYFWHEKFIKACKMGLLCISTQNFKALKIFATNFSNIPLATSVKGIFCMVIDQNLCPPPICNERPLRGSPRIHILGGGRRSCPCQDLKFN